MYIQWVTVCVLDADRIVSGSRDKTICMWDVNSGECVKVLDGHSSVRTNIYICIYRYLYTFF